MGAASESLRWARQNYAAAELTDAEATVASAALAQAEQLARIADAIEGILATLRPEGRYEDIGLDEANSTPTAERPACGRCNGCGRIANTDDGEPWTAWTSLPSGSDVMVRLGIVQPIPCPDCAGGTR